jgi:hypothetical protein
MRRRGGGATVRIVERIPRLKRDYRMISYEADFCAGFLKVIRNLSRPGASPSLPRPCADDITLANRKRPVGRLVAEHVFPVYLAGVLSRALETSDTFACFSASVSIALMVLERFASAPLTLASLCLRSSSAIQDFE